jgi:hypothetical protein
VSPLDSNASPHWAFTCVAITPAGVHAFRQIAARVPG